MVSRLLFARRKVRARAIHCSAAARWLCEAPPRLASKREKTGNSVTAESARPRKAPLSAVRTRAFKNGLRPGIFHVSRCPSLISCLFLHAGGGGVEGGLHHLFLCLIKSTRIKDTAPAPNMFPYWQCVSPSHPGWFPPNSPNFGKFF